VASENEPTSILYYERVCMIDTRRISNNWSGSQIMTGRSERFGDGSRDVRFRTGLVKGLVTDQSLRERYRRQLLKRVTDLSYSSFWMFVTSVKPSALRLDRRNSCRIHDRDQNAPALEPGSSNVVAIILVALAQPAPVSREFSSIDRRAWDKLLRWRNVGPYAVGDHAVCGVPSSRTSFICGR